MNKQRMRIPFASAQLEWRTIAVAGQDPLVFAKELQGALQELTDSGFTINSQMQRDNALIITASRVTQLPQEAQPAPPPVLRRRIIDLPAAHTQGATTEEVLYHFVENGRQKQLSFPTLVEALRVVKRHLEVEILPINLTTVSMTRFEPLAFPTLLKLFAEELQCPPG
jgi:hypothetical protein